MDFKTFSERERQLVDICNRLVDYMEYEAEKGNIEQYKLYENRLSQLEEELQGLREQFQIG